MGMDDQIILLRKIYKEEIKRVYDSRFQMRLMAVMPFNKDFYYQRIKRIEVLSKIIEEAAIDCKPKRMMHYLFLIDFSVEEVIEQTVKDYKTFWENKLTK
jgi:hypothetical protein